MDSVEQRCQEIISTAIDGAPAEVGPSAHGQVAIRIHDGRTLTFEVRWAGEGWPQDVRLAAHDVAEQWPTNVVLLARRLSPGAIEWLRARGANWADEAGQVRILGPDGLVVIREPAQHGDERRRLPRFTWSKSAITVAEMVLARESAPLRAAELARATGWSVAQTATVLASFDRQGWTIKRGTARGPRAHRELLDAPGMLAAWSAALAHEPRTKRLAHRATQDVMTLLSDQLAPALDRHTKWALSGWGGLELAVPFATRTPSLHIYVARTDFGGTLSQTIEKASLREVDEGGRITFWAADARVIDLAWRTRGVPIVSAPRLYADLSALGARGQDAADHVREQLIDPLHLSGIEDRARTNG